ncbi:hypothetical protein MD537_08215 [Flavihumibacter sediminis]|nr:hypothetical protein [Flavihumibacter sediminis]
MTTHFNYWLTGSGWAEAFFTSDNQNIRFELSYLSDPLADLLEGLCKLINNQSDTERIAFFDEPGEHSLVISKIDKDEIKIEIFRDYEKEGISEADKSQDTGELIYLDTDTLRNLALIIFEGIESLLGRHTLKDYKEKWVSFDFPLDEYKQLQQLLK